MYYMKISGVLPGKINGSRMENGDGTVVYRS